MADISVEYLGYKLSSPVIAAPSGSTGTADLARVAEDSGVGAIVMRTLYAPETEDVRWPHYELIRHDMGTIRASTLYSSEHTALCDSDRYAEELRKCKEFVNIPIIASIGCMAGGGWAESAATVEQAGADAVEVHIHCPTGEGAGSRGRAAEMIEAVSKAKSRAGIPVVVKMTPQLENPAATAAALESAGADAVVMFDRFTGLEIDLETEQPLGGLGYAWHGGPWSIFYAMRWISEAAPRLSIPIAGCGGVGAWQDVVKYILAGATVAQSASALMTQGYQIVRAFNQGLSDWMDRKGHEKLSDFRGKVSVSSAG